MRRGQGYWRMGGVLGIMVLLLAACGTAGRIGHPTGKADILVQLTYNGGGMTPSRLDSLTGSFPGFSLRGDGTLLYSKDDRYYQTQLDEAAIQRLLTLAINDVHFGDLPDFVGPQCCDMPGGSLAITTSDLRKTVSVSMIDSNSDPNSPESRMSRMLGALEALRTGQDPIYQPAGGRLYAEANRYASDALQAPAWPIGGVSLAKAEQMLMADGTGLHLTGPELKQAYDLLHGIQPFTENGVGYRVLLIPDSP